MDLTATPASARAWRSLLSVQWGALERATTARNAGHAQRFVDSALEHSTRVEKDHRRFVGGRYLLSVQDCARLMVLRTIASYLWAPIGNAGEAPRAPGSWRDAAEIRPDIVHARAAAECFRDGDVWPWPLGEAAALAAFDYARDAAGVTL